MTNPPQPPAPQPADSGETLGKKIDALIDAAETYASNDKSTFAGMDNNPMNRHVIAMGVQDIVAAAVQAAQVELLSNLSRKIEPYLVDDPRQPNGEENRHG